MVLHVLIFPVTAVIAVLVKKGRIPGNGSKGFRLFLAVALTGNLLGLLLTAEDLREREEAGLCLERQDAVYTQEEWNVSVDGEAPEAVTVRIPKRETGEEEEDGDFLDSEALRRRQELQDIVDEYNRSLADPDYYYLPESWNGKSFDWEKKKDHTGELFAALLLAAGVLMLFFQNREEEKSRQKREEQLAAEYPPFIMKLTLLLQAGLSARSAFERIARDYEQQSFGRINLACEEVLVLCRELDSGVSETEAYRRLGERCGQIRYRTLATLLTQNLRKGSRFLTDLLEREAVDAWEERKRNARVQGEIASTRLLLPMVLMLTVVIALIMIPAFLSFY